MKIFFELIKEPVSGKCEVTGKKVSYSEGYGFFVDGKVTKPVSESEALASGFTMKKQTLNKLVSLLDEGRKFEEVQKAAHEEFEDLK